MLKITIAGASGYIGQRLIDLLQHQFFIKGLSRSHKKSQTPNVEWIANDLFSLSSTSKALQNTDIAIYLVHSMMPSSRLFQGNFQDTDLLLADNFARACVNANVKQIIYLGGLVPKENISKHLASRKEVEEIFKSTGIPYTILRAGMIVGDGGSSFEILKNLVFNLPAMVLPKWTQSQTQTFYIDDLLNIIKEAIGNKDYQNQTLDLINGEKITYHQLILQTAQFYHRKKLLIPVPINYTSFSKLWVSFFGNSDYELVSPLIDSLLCDLDHSEINPLISKHIQFKTYMSMLHSVKGKTKARAKNKIYQADNTVRSIQRLPNPFHLSSEVISQKYMQWLPNYFKYVIFVKKEGDIIKFVLLNFKNPLLILKKMNSELPIDRVKFHIIGGFLSKTTNTGWLEFRVLCGGTFTLTSIHGFIPSLPWYIYKYTQAQLHLHVMKNFSFYLEKNKS